MATTKTKKVVEKTPTVEQRLKEKNQAFECLSKQYALLNREHEGLRNSFAMIKSNYEREKNRLDKVIDSLLNHSKTK